MSDELTRLLRRLRLYSRQLGLELLRLAGGAPELYRGAGIFLPPASICRRQLCPQPRHLSSFVLFFPRERTGRNQATDQQEEILKKVCWYNTAKANTSRTIGKLNPP